MYGLCKQCHVATDNANRLVTLRGHGLNLIVTNQPDKMAPGKLKMSSKRFPEEFKIEAMNPEQVVNMTICWFKPL